jgi:hypothetical protein
MNGINVPTSLESVVVDANVVVAAAAHDDDDDDEMLTIVAMGRRVMTAILVLTMMT